MMIKWFVAFLILATPASAESWLNDAGIEKAFKGITIDGEYTDGTNFVESYLPDGVADYKDPGREVKGVWSTNNNTFCTMYEEMDGGCFSVQQRGANCFEFYFSADRPSQTEGAKPQRWVARGWRRGETKTCGDLTV